MIAAQELLLQCRATVCPRGRRMMSRRGVPGIALADQPGMAGDLGAATIDDDLGGMLVGADRLPDQALGHRVSVGVDRDIAVQINDTLEDLAYRRQDAGQRSKMRLLQDIGRLGRQGPELAAPIPGTRRSRQ